MFSPTLRPLRRSVAAFVLLALAVSGEARAQVFRCVASGGNTCGWPPAPCLFNVSQATPFGAPSDCSDQEHLWRGNAVSDRGIASGNAYVDFHRMGLITLCTEHSLRGETTVDDLVISGPDTGGVAIPVSLRVDRTFASHLDPGGFGGASASGSIEANLVGPGSLVSILDQNVTANGTARVVGAGYAVPNTPLTLKISATAAAFASGPADAGIPNATATMTIHLPIGEPVLDVPAGYDVNSPSMNIVHNFWLGNEICDVPAVTYGTAKTNSQGCAPEITATGNARVGGTDPFVITASNVINQKLGLLFYGLTPTNRPLQGGTRLVAHPFRRTPIQNSGGNAGPDDCSGTYAFDMNARIRSGVDVNLMAGRQVYCQYWSRDPASGTGTGLTNALTFRICP